MSPALMVVEREDGSQIQVINAEPGGEAPTEGADVVILRSLTGEAWRVERPRARRQSTPTGDAARTAVEQELGDLKGQQAYGKRYLVSYPWGDNADSNREELVDRLCEEARKRGVIILRDKTTLVHGELISEFMKQSGEGDRVFIFLSDRYLRSPYCMFELFEMWRNARQNTADFLRRVRIFTLDGTQIGRPQDWLEYTKFWIEERDGLKKAIDEVGWENAGDEAIKRYRLIETFAGNVSDVLAVFADAVQPRKFEDFMRYGFDDEAATGSEGARRGEQPRPPLLEEQEQGEQAIKAALRTAASAGPERLQAALARRDESPSADVQVTATRGPTMVSISEGGLPDFEADKLLKSYAEPSNHIFADLLGGVRVRWPIVFFLSEGNPQGAHLQTLGNAASIISLGRPYSLMDVSLAIDSALAEQNIRLVRPWFLRYLARESGVDVSQVSTLGSLVALPREVVAFLNDHQLRGSRTLLIHGDEFRELDPEAIAEALGFSPGTYAMLESDARPTFQLMRDGVLDSEFSAPQDAVCPAC